MDVVASRGFLTDVLPVLREVRSTIGAGIANKADPAAVVASLAENVLAARAGVPEAAEIATAIGELVDTIHSVLTLCEELAKVIQDLKSGTPHA